VQRSYAGAVVLLIKSDLLLVTSLLLKSCNSVSSHYSHEVCFLFVRPFVCLFICLLVGRFDLFLESSVAQEIVCPLTDITQPRLHYSGSQLC